MAANFLLFVALRLKTFVLLNKKSWFWSLHENKRHEGILYESIWFSLARWPLGSAAELQSSWEIDHIVTELVCTLSVGSKSRSISGWLVHGRNWQYGDPIFPLLFISILERVMEATECNRTPSGINVHGTVIKDVRFADDVNLMSERERHLQTLVDQLYTSSKIFGLQVNCNKSKVMVYERRPTHHPAITGKRKLLAFEMRCYRRILKICWKDKVSNKVICERAKRQWTVMDLIKQRKLKLFGHICRMGDRRLIKTVMLAEWWTATGHAEDRQRGGQTTL